MFGRRTHRFFPLTQTLKIVTFPAGTISCTVVMLKRFPCLLLTCAFLPALFLLSAGGCNVLQNLNLIKKEEDPPLDRFITETEDGKPRLVGDCVAIGTNQTIPVHGFGLVVNLPGTGGEDANTIHYREVHNTLNRDKWTGIRSILARPDTAVVEIIGEMQPGIQRGDRFDVRILLPPDTETRSLRGAVLLETDLREKEIFGRNDIGIGAPRARVAGPVMVDDPMATELNNPSGLKKGTILSGAVTLTSRSLSLIMKERSFFGAEQIAKSINDRFTIPTGSRKGVATAETDVHITLDIHPSYANDVDRYVRVVRSIACYETTIQRHQRIERLKEELLNPETSQHAAFQLEAIGRQGIEALQLGLQSSDTEVQFHAATSLAYLGDGTSAKVLAEIAQLEPAFRVYALNALSVMKNDLEAETYLQELLHLPSAETRYGAFRALKNRNPLDHTIRGEMLGGQFAYHSITSQAAPMVHITTRKLPEVVLFGSDIFLRQPFALEAGATIIVNGQSPGNVVITRIVSAGVDERREVSNRLDAIIRGVVELGGTYPDVVQMLRRADAIGVLSCRLEIDRLPEPNRIYRRRGGEELVDEEDVKPKSFWERMNPRNIFAPNPGEKSSDYTGTVNASSRD